MAWFHDEQGRPATWRTGKFDPEHLYPLLLILIPIAFVLIRGK